MLRPVSSFCMEPRTGSKFCFKKWLKCQKISDRIDEFLEKTDKSCGAMRKGEGNKGKWNRSFFQSEK